MTVTAAFIAAETSARAHGPKRAFASGVAAAEARQTVISLCRGIVTRGLVCVAPDCVVPVQLVPAVVSAFPTLTVLVGLARACTTCNELLISL